MVVVTNLVSLIPRNSRKSGQAGFTTPATPTGTPWRKSRRHKVFIDPETSGHRNGIKEFQIKIPFFTVTVSLLLSILFSVLVSLWRIIQVS